MLQIKSRIEKGIDGLRNKQSKGVESKENSNKNFIYIIYYPWIRDIYFSFPASLDGRILNVDRGRDLVRI